MGSTASLLGRVKSPCSKHLIFSSLLRLYSVCRHQSIQHLLLLRNTILILARLMLVGMGSTRILTVTWSRKLSSRTSASHTPNKPAGHRTRKNASLPCIRTAPCHRDKYRTCLLRCERVGVRFGRGHSLRNVGRNLPSP